MHFALTSLLRVRVVVSLERARSTHMSVMSNGAGSTSRNSPLETFITPFAHIALLVDRAALHNRAYRSLTLVPFRRPQ